MLQSICWINIQPPYNNAHTFTKAFHIIAMKKHEIIFSTIKLPLDAIIVFVSFFIGREIRLITDLIPSISLPIQTIETHYLIYYAWIGSLLYIFLFIVHGLYNSRITHSKIKEFLDIIQYWVYWFLFFSVWVFFLKWIIIDNNNDIPRLIILFTLILSTFWVIIQRIILNTIQYKLLENKIIEKKNIVLISNKNASDIQHIISDIDDSKIYTLLWYINNNPEKLKYINIWFNKKTIKSENTKSKKKNNKQVFNKSTITASSLPYLWSIKDFHLLAQKKWVDEVLYIDSDYSPKQLIELWELSKIFGIRYRYITNTFDITQSNTTLSLINQIPVLEIENTPLWIWWRALKRIFDIGSGVVWLLLFLPLFIVIAIAIKYDDPSAPIFYKNKRIGQDGKIFQLYKFRYIQWKYCIKDAYWVDPDDDTALKHEKKLIKKLSTRDWPLYKIKGDPRKTKIGTFIEKYSLDELPQLYNVLLWNMSLVWPRPHQPREVKKYELWEKRVLTIKPWITWMAQVNGRDQNQFEDEARMDIFYIENWSMLLDFKIILKTFWTLLNRK